MQARSLDSVPTAHHAHHAVLFAAAGLLLLCQPWHPPVRWIALSVWLTGLALALACTTPEPGRLAHAISPYGRSLAFFAWAGLVSLTASEPSRFLVGHFILATLALLLTPPGGSPLQLLAVQATSAVAAEAMRPGAAALAEPARRDAALALLWMAGLAALLAHSRRHTLRSLERLRRHALRDPLTGLDNRRAVERRVRRLAHQGTTPISVLYIDLDGLKGVNDTKGHAAGDALLCDFAERLRRTVRAGDTVARVGGDEFVALLPGAGRRAGFQAASRLLADARRPPAVRCSIGLATGPARAVEALVCTADRAMYQAKGAGGDRLSLAPRP